MPASPLSRSEDPPNSVAPPPPSAPADFAVALTFSADRVLVAVSGELDLLTVRAFGAFLDLAAGRERHVVVNLAGVTFLDCSGLGQLARALGRVRQLGGELAVVQPSPMAYRLLELAGLTDVTEVEGPLPATSATTVALEASADDLLDENLAAALREIVERAAATVGHADGASLSLTLRGSLATVAASDDVVAGMDADQYSLKEGPCVSAAVEGVGFCIESMSAESRWPSFVARASRRGINSVISTPLLVDGRSVGALNIYSRTARAFALPQGELAWQLATQVAAVLAASSVASVPAS